jgi:hypothetical protein
MGADYVGTSTTSSKAPVRTQTAARNRPRACLLSDAKGCRSLIPPALPPCTSDPLLSSLFFDLTVSFLHPGASHYWSHPFPLHHTIWAFRSHWSICARTHPRLLTPTDDDEIPRTLVPGLLERYSVTPLPKTQFRFFPQYQRLLSFSVSIGTPPTCPHRRSFNYTTANPVPLCKLPPHDPQLATNLPTPTSMKSRQSEVPH